MPEVNITLLWTGILLGLIGLFTAVFRNAPKHFIGYIRRFFVVRVDVLNNDNLFEWLKVWFDKDNYTRRARLISAAAVPVSDVNLAGTIARKWKIVFTPAPGMHVIFFKGHPVLINRDRRDIPAAGGGVAGIRDSFILYFFTRKQELVRRFLKEAQSVADQEKANKLTIYTGDLYQNWTAVSYRDLRPLESVVLDNGIKEDIHADIKRFLASEDWYKSMAIPFHRGYLFYGPPGNGKSSLATALASEFHLDMYLLNLSNLNDARLMNLLSTIPSHSVLLLEDVDAAFVRRESIGKVTFSGFLNALDGIHTKEGMIVFMSTNHIERLDPALLRPGRVDHKVFLGSPSYYQIYEIFLRFYPTKVDEAKQFASWVAHKELSMATIQEYLLNRRDSMRQAIDDVAQIDTFSPNNAAQPLAAGIPEPVYT